MKITQFEDIIAWQKAQDLAFEIYKKFKTNNDYGFKNQIQRASILLKVLTEIPIKNSLGFFIFQKLRAVK